MPIYVRINKKTLTLMVTNFWETFGKFSVNIQCTVGDSYLNKYRTILVPYFSESEIHYAFGSSNTALHGPRINQSEIEFVSSYIINNSRDPIKTPGN